MEDDLRKGDLIVANSYYNSIVRLISQPRYIHEIPADMTSSFLKCASRLLALQIMRQMMNTIENLLEVVSNSLTIPVLNVSFT